MGYGESASYRESEAVGAGESEAMKAGGQESIAESGLKGGAEAIPDPDAGCIDYHRSANKSYEDRGAAGGQ